MSNTPLHVVGIGNAIVDVMAYVQDTFLDAHGLTKGAMALVDEKRVEVLYRAMGACAESSGGSAANTLAGLASLGAEVAFIGKVSDDAFGDIFRHDMRAEGVEFETPSVNSKKGTARSLIVVTPDAQRTMNTYLGVAPELRSEDVDEELIARAQILYIEGYLWDLPETKGAIIKAAQIAQENGTKVAFTLSDTFCVARHRMEFLELIDEHLDILFANEQEIFALYETDSLDSAIASVRNHCEIAAVTRSEKGSIIVTPHATVTIAAEPIPQVVDTTGAGDLYASGVLYGLTNGYSLEKAGALGSKCASRILSHLGARPQKSLHELVA